MNCKKCGSILSENDQFCKNCGEAVNSQISNGGEQSSLQTFNNSLDQSVGIGQNMNTQQSYYNNINDNQPTNKSSNEIIKYIAIGIAIIVGIVLILFVIGKFINKDDKGGLINSGSSGINQTSKTNYKVNFKGFTFEIPDNLVYEEESNALIIGDEKGTWTTALELEQGSFSQLQANKNQLQSLMQQNGYVSSAANEKTIGGVNFITLELTKSGQKALAALAKANSMYFIALTALNQDNEYDYKLLENIAPIVKSAQYTGNTTNNISSANKIDMSGISELAK